MSELDLLRRLDNIANRVYELETRETGLTSPNGVAIGSVADAKQLIVTGRVEVTATVSPGTGLEAALTVTANAYSDAGGSQWAAQFNRVYTVTGQSTLDELGGYYNALYHDKGFTLADWKGIETGGGFISGASSVVTMFTGLEANIPTVTDSGSVTTAAAIRIPSKATTGITNVYAILQELVAVQSLFKGPIYIQNQALGLESYRDDGATRIQATTHQASASSGARLRVAFSRGTRASPSQVNSGDLIGQLEGFAYIDGDYRQIGALAFYAAGTPGAGSYPGDLYMRLVSDSATAIATKAILSEAGDLTLGATKKTGGVGGLYAGVVAVKDGVSAPSTVSGMAVIYVDTSDGDLKVKFSDGTVKTIVTDT